MAIFTKSDPATKLQRDLDAAQRDLKAAIARRDNFVALLKAAEAKAAECSTIVNRLGADAVDDTKLQPAIDRQLAADKLVAARTRPLAGVSEEIAVLEKQLVKISDEKVRAETAAAIEALGVRLEKAAKSFDAAVTELAAVCDLLSPIIVDAQGLAQFAASVRTETPPAIAMIMGIIKNRIAATLAGNAPASLPREPEAPPVSKLVASSPTKTIFLLHAVKFRDANGMQQCVQKLNMLSLPLALAACALEHKHAIATSDPRCRKMNQTFGAIAPHPDHCIDLDALLTGIASTTPSPHTNVFRDFEPLDRGPAVHGVMKVQREQPMAVAARTLPPDAKK